MGLHHGRRGPGHQARAAGGAADGSPDGFDLGGVGAALLATTYESETIVVDGIGAPASLSVANGEYAINGGAWASAPTTVTDGDFVKVRGVSPASVSSVQDVVLTIGDVADAFSISTVANAEASALIGRFTADPGDARRALIDACVGNLKAAGVWTKLDVLYFFAAHDSQAAEQNWIQDAFHATAVSNPIFTADRGYAGDGVAAYIDTGFNNLTGSALWTQDTMSLGGYVNQYAGSPDSFLGLVAGVVSLRVGASTTNINTRIHSTTSFNPAFANATPGHILITRDSATSSRCVRNGVTVNTSAAASTASVNANVSVFRLTTNFNADRVACVHLGGSLTPTEAADLYGAILTYLTALGAN